MSGQTILATSQDIDADFSCLDNLLNPVCRWGDYSAATRGNGKGGLGTSTPLGGLSLAHVEERPTRERLRPGKSPQRLAPIEGHVDFLGVRVLQAVVHCFLGNAIERQFQIRL